MEAPLRPKRYRANPIEVAVFAVVTGLFAHSVYRLFYDRQDWQATALSPTAANPLGESRGPASSSASADSFVNVDAGCDAQAEHKTRARKARVSGEICGRDPASVGAEKLVKTSVTNETSHYNGTVFLDVNSGKYSTDYLPLSEGRNMVRVEFLYEGGRKASQDLVIVRN